MKLMTIAENKSFLRQVSTDFDIINDNGNILQTHNTSNGYLNISKEIKEMPDNLKYF